MHYERREIGFAYTFITYCPSILRIYERYIVEVVPGVSTGKVSVDKPFPVPEF